jgi:hypothetical protein
MGVNTPGDRAGFGGLFYPPDEIHPTGNRIEIDFVDSGTMFTLAIDISSTSGGLVDPATLVGFNPQPEPPAGDSLAIFIPLTGGVGAPGAIQISLSFEVLDEFGAPLPISEVAVDPE